MTQQYQHIEQQFGLKILSGTLRLSQILEYETAKQREEIAVRYDRHLQELEANSRRTTPPAKHPLLMPPFVKEK